MDTDDVCCGGRVIPSIIFFSSFAIFSTPARSLITDQQTNSHLLFTAIFLLLLVIRLILTHFWQFCIFGER